MNNSDINPCLQSDNHFDSGWQDYMDGNPPVDDSSSYREGYAAAREHEEDLIAEAELKAEYNGHRPHAHHWNEDDYCSLCGADGRA